MKITKIELKDFHQFRDVVINLTYPAGHEKAGRPLEKVCIIGQSGTGKTTLLKLINGFILNSSELDEEYGIENINNNIFISSELDNLLWTRTLSLSKNDDGVSTIKNIWETDSIFLDGDPIEFELALNHYKNFVTNDVTKLIYMPGDTTIETVIDNPTSLIFNPKQKYFDFRKISIRNVWKKIEAQVTAQQENEIKIWQSMYKLVEERADTKNIDAALKKINEIRAQEFNPLKKIAEKCLDPILKNFNLRVKTVFDFDKKDDIGFIKIEDFNGNEIPNGLLSTGTKQIILSALPLYLLEPTQAIILYDEPERSLYPNIQKLIVDFYTSLTTNSQFFFATHSPIIASCFEPWEIVELKFNSEGYVYQELYYPKNAERHVDNYTIVPAYLTYDLILKEVFDVKEVDSYERSEKITEVLMLRDQLKQYKEENKSKTKEAKEVYATYKKLAGQLFWDFETV